MNSAITKALRGFLFSLLLILMIPVLSGCSVNTIPERIAGRIIRGIIARDYDLIYGVGEEEEEDSGEEEEEKTERKVDKKEAEESGEEPSEEAASDDEETITEDDLSPDIEEEEEEEDSGEDEVEDTYEETAEEETVSEDSIAGEDTSEEIAEAAEENEKAYYFSTLETGEKKVYLEIYNAIFEMKDNVVLSTKDTEEAEKIYNLCMMDHPEFFFCEGFTSTVVSSAGETMGIDFTGKYTVDKNERRKKESEIKASADKILSKVPQDDSDYEKVKYIYEWIIKNTEYKIDAPENQNLTSVLLTHSSVCQGYTMAFKYLLDRMGIFCTVVYGTAADGNHAWNLVKMDGTYCFVDCTWGDSSYKDINNSDANRISYNYFGCNKELLTRTHTITEKGKLPDCTSLDEYYYVKEARYFTSADKDRLKAVFDHARENKEKVFTIRASNEEVYNEICDLLFTKREIFNVVPDADKVTYIEDKTEFTLTFNL